MNELFAYFIASAHKGFYTLFLRNGCTGKRCCRFRQGEHGDAPPLLVVGFATFVILGEFSAFKLVSFGVLFFGANPWRHSSSSQASQSNPPLPYGAFHFKNAFFWIAIPFLLLFIFDSSLILMPMYHGQDDNSYLVIIQKLK